MSDLVYVLQAENENDFRYLLANKPAKAFIGLTNNDPGKLIEEVVPEKLCQLLKINILKTLKKKEMVTFSSSFTQPVIKRGQETYYEAAVTPIFGQEKCTHILVVIRDITERKWKEKELSSLNERLELIWNRAADVVYTFDPSQKFIKVNHAFEQLLGWTQEELMADPSISIIPTNSKEDLENIMKKLKKGEVIPSHKVERRTKDGGIVHVLASYSPIFDIFGNWDGAIVMYKDISNQKKMYEQLTESEKRYRLIAEHSSDLIKVVDLEGDVLYASPSHKKLLDVDPDYFLNKSILSFVHSNDMYELQHALTYVIETKKLISLDIRSLKKKRGVYLV